LTGGQQCAAVDDDASPDTDISGGIEECPPLAFGAEQVFSECSEIAVIADEDRALQCEGVPR
jgi:hypothetical protein